MRNVPDERVLVAHLLRRTGFGPLPGQVDGLAGSGINAAIDAVLAAPALDPGSPSLNDETKNDEDALGPVRQWLGLMAKPEAGLHEKMVWFWHGHLTSSYDKVGSWKMMWQQHLLLRERAFGNFRELVRAITIDPAMLVYLDGAESTADAPNENYGRELMELFTLGRGNYSQEDVRAAAKALSGWTVDYDSGAATFVPESANQTPVTFLGRNVVRADDVVDTACDHPACAPFIVGKLHRFFTGVDPEPDRRAELAAIFTSGGLEIRPVVEAILRDPSFLALRLNRPRYPVEWATGAIGALGLDDRNVAVDACFTLNQTPFFPPNVAGWPGGARWLAPSYALARAGVAVQAPGIGEVRDARDPIAAALNRCSLYEVSDTTASALKAAADRMPADLDPDGRAAVLLATVTSSPEFALA